MQDMRDASTVAARQHQARSVFSVLVRDDVSRIPGRAADRRVRCVAMRTFSMGLLALASLSAHAAGPVLRDIADAYALSLEGQAGTLNYFVARRPSAPADDAATSALVALHGHPRDANKTLAAGELAARQAGRAADTLVVAPLFQVASPADERCHSAGVPAAQAGDALWTCSSWMAGGAAKGSSVSSFAALDQLLACQESAA